MHLASLLWDGGPLRLLCCLLLRLKLRTELLDLLAMLLGRLVTLVDKALQFLRVLVVTVPRITQQLLELSALLKQLSELLFEVLGVALVKVATVTPWDSFHRRR